MKFLNDITFFFAVTALAGKNRATVSFDRIFFLYFDKVVFKKTQKISKTQVQKFDFPNSVTFFSKKEIVAEKGREDSQIGLRN